jgi:hypothetical protein
LHNEAWTRVRDFTPNSTLLRIQKSEICHKWSLYTLSLMASIFKIENLLQTTPMVSSGKAPCRDVWSYGLMLPLRNTHQRQTQTESQSLQLRTWISSGTRRGFLTLNTLCHGAPFALEAELIAVQEAFRIACSLIDSFAA